MKIGRGARPKPLDIHSINELALRLGYSEKELRRIANSKRRYYRVEERTDRSGKPRTVHESIGSLKKLLDAIATSLLDKVDLPDCVHGYRKGRSVITNARQHVRKSLVCTLDIKGFFPSIHFRRVTKTFVELGCSEEVARFLTHLVTCDYCLPHGFPTSPTLSNIVVSKLARRIQRVCDSYNLAFTMYSDDITISGTIEERKFRKLLDENVLPSIRQIVKQEGFRLRSDKNDKLGKRDRQKVTGITVNRKPNIPKEKRRVLLSTIKQYQLDDIPTNNDFDLLKAKQRLRGKIAWAQSVNPSFGKLLLIEFQKIDWSRQAVLSGN